MRSCLLSSGCSTGQSEHPLCDAATPPRYDDIHQRLRRRGCAANASSLLCSRWVVTAMTPSFRGHMTGSGSNRSTQSRLQQLQRVTLSQSMTELSGMLTVDSQLAAKLVAAAGDSRCYRRQRLRWGCWRAHCLFYLNDHSATLHQKHSADQVTLIVSMFLYSMCNNSVFGPTSRCVPPPPVFSFFFVTLMLKQMGFCMNAYVTQDKWSINNSDGNQKEQLSLFLDLKIGFDSMTKLYIYHIRLT